MHSAQPKWITRPRLGTNLCSNFTTRRQTSLVLAHNAGRISSCRMGSANAAA